jgi:large subunit ribosomal protein L22
MEARAINRYISTSPRKMRLVIDLIRGKSVDEALNILHYSPKHASRLAEKVLRSAVSNLQNKDEAGRLEPGEMIVKEAYVDGGMSMKRILPAPMGRAFRIRKRSNHVTIVVAPNKGVRKAAAPKRPKAQKPDSAPAKKAEAKPATAKKAEAKPATAKQESK